MKLFQIISNFDLQQKPDWLDEFRKKYDQPFPYHITFKQKTQVAETDIPALHKEVQNLAKTFRPISVKFDKIAIGKSSKGAVIMINSPNKDKRLHQYQQMIKESLSKYGNVHQKRYQPFEDKFTPHITIGRRLNQEKLEAAKKELPGDVSVSARIDSISLYLFDSDEDEPSDVITFDL